MKSFIKAFREYSDMKTDLQRKLVWNPERNRWLVTSFFSVEYIKFRKMEVVAHG